MAKDKPYQGHKNWNHWNVSLWINNDAQLYKLAKDCIANNKGNKMQAAREFFNIIGMSDIPGRYRTDTPKTPDGAPYTVTSIRAALAGLE